MTPEAHKHLSKRDPVLKLLIREHGFCDLVPEKRRSPFQSLVQAVAHQQLNGTAANTILSRFKKLFPGRKFPRPEDLAEGLGRTNPRLRIFVRKNKIHPRHRGKNFVRRDSKFAANHKVI